MTNLSRLTTSQAARSTNLVEQIKDDLRWTDWALSKIPMPEIEGARCRWCLCVDDRAVIMPIFIASVALTPHSGSPWILIPLALSSTACGATLELAHQRFDRQRDSSTNTPTWAVRLGMIKFDTLADRLLHDLIPNLMLPIHALLCLVSVSPEWLVPLGCFIAWRVLLPRLR